MVKGIKLASLSVVTVVTMIAVAAFVYFRPESPTNAQARLIEKSSPTGACVLSIGDANVVLSARQSEGLRSILHSQPIVLPVAEDPGPVAMGCVTIGGKARILLHETVFIWHADGYAFFWPTNKLAGMSELVHGMGADGGKRACETVATMLER